MYYIAAITVRPVRNTVIILTSKLPDTIKLGETAAITRLNDKPKSDQCGQDTDQLGTRPRARHVPGPRPAASVPGL